MPKSVLYSALAFSFLFTGTAFSDLGGNHLIANSPGRCWRVIHRDFSVKGNAIAGYSFKLIDVGGSGETDDIISYELTIKENFVEDTGWDESKTKVFTGTGLIKSISFGRVRFEFYVDPGNGGDLITVQGYYHPGDGTSDFDDRVVMRLPTVITPGVANQDDCCDPMNDGAEL